MTGWRRGESTAERLEAVGVSRDLSAEDACEALLTKLEAMLGHLRAATSGLTPDDKLWLAILERTKALDTMPDEAVAEELRRGDFPEHLIRRYLDHRPLRGHGPK